MTHFIDPSRTGLSSTPTSAPPSGQTHVIFGAGQVGSRLADLLLSEGHEVRLCRRGAPGEPRPGLTWKQGDATDRSFADDACAGADVVYNCANPPDYAGWDGVIQPLYAAIWQAAGRASARLVALDNLYSYGVPGDVPFDEDTPARPCSNKGRIRAALADELLEAHARGDVRACLGRASDFFGPNAVLSAVFSPRFLQRLAEGKALEAFGDPDMPHAYSYLPDVARGLATLGNPTHADVADGRVWHLPVAWTGTTRGLMERFADALDRPLPPIRVPPSWLLRALSFVPLVGALREMVYQWQVPYVPSDERFVSTFGIRATSVTDAVRQTLRTHGSLPLDPVSSTTGHRSPTSTPAPSGP